MTRASHEPRPGRIEVAWRLDGGTGEVDVAVPPGTQADLVLPDGTSAVPDPGRHRRTWPRSQGAAR